MRFFSERVKSVRQRLRRKLRVVREWWFYLRLGAVAEVDFTIVSCERNAHRFALRCLDSVYRQAYDPRRIRHIFIDDASSDGTAELIEHWLATHPGHRVEFVRRTQRWGGTANTLAGFRMAAPGSVVIELNGDDWLAGRRVLAFLQRVYADAAVWMTYNTPRYASGAPALWAEQIPEAVVAANGFREMDGWISSHPHTFRRELFEHIREEIMIDPETGAYWESADDQAIYLAMLELAGGRARHLHRATYVYNFHEQSHAYSDASGSADRARRIRGQAKCQPLEAL